MEAKSYGVQFLIFEMLISHWWRPRFLLEVNPCDRTVNSFPKWYDNWKLAKKWGSESQFLNLVTFLTNTKNFKNPWLGAPWTFFGLFQWCQGMFLKVPEGFQRKNFSSCPETLLLPFIDLELSAADRLTPRGSQDWRAVGWAGWTGACFLLLLVFWFWQVQARESWGCSTPMLVSTCPGTDTK